MGHLWDLIHVKIHDKVNLVALKYVYYDEMPPPQRKCMAFGVDLTKNSLVMIPLINKQNPTS